MALQDDRLTTAGDGREANLGQRLDSLGWGLFLLMLGALWLVPEDWGVPEGTRLIGAGVIVLGLVLVRYLNGLPISGFWMFLGALALGTGVASVLGLNLPVFPFLIVIAGAGLLLKPLLDRMRR